MVIEDITFDLRRNGTGAAREYMIVTSIDGFSSAQSLGSLTLASTNTLLQTFTGSNTGNTPVTGQVEVRIVGAGASSGAGNTHFHAASVDASFISDPNGIPLDPTGIMVLGGDYTQLGTGTMKIDLAGSQPGEYDQLQVAGNVSLNGTLDVSAIDGFEPAQGQTYDILTADSVSGTFSNVVAPSDMNLDVIYTGDTVSLQVAASGLLGDVNLDGEVNFLDIGPFITLLSTASPQFEGDVNQDGVMNFLDIGPFIDLLAGL